MSNIIYTNPRKSVTIEDWPYGQQRTKVTFEIDANNRGERCIRTTINPKTGRPTKPKAATYSPLVRLVDGSDGRIYIMSYTEYGFIKVMQGNMKFEHEVIHRDDSRFAELVTLLHAGE